MFAVGLMGKVGRCSLPGYPGNCLHLFAGQIQNTDETGFSGQAEGERSFGGISSLKRDGIGVEIPQDELRNLLTCYSQLQGSAAM